ncbi:MAG: hypothetical protein R3D67_18425 [Hyphomicrobiaceae bacterium]
MAEREHDGGRWARAMLVAGAGGLSVLNGLATSPLFDSVMFYLEPVLPRLLRDLDLLFYVNGMFAFALTFLLAGVPARLYERFCGLTRGSVISHAIWLVAALVLSLPGLLGAIGYFDIE